MRASTEWKSLGEVDLFVRLSVAVFGTLRSGCGNHARLLANNPSVLSMTPATVEGFELHSLGGRGGLPIVIPKPGSTITVEVITIDDSPRGDLLRDDLDRLEGFRPYDPAGPGIYDRVLAQATTADGEHVEVWLYAAGSAVSREDLGSHTRIASGDWVNR